LEKRRGKYINLTKKAKKGENREVVYSDETGRKGREPLSSSSRRAKGKKKVKGASLFSNNG